MRHNLRKHPLYIVWQDMKKRCYNPNHEHYGRYGGRGIIVCESWKNSFQNFLNDMGERPENLTLERINVNGNYDPLNCKWETKCNQAYNRNRKKTNTSGRTGVSWYDRYSKWCSRITVEKKTIILGYFITFEEAVMIREEAELKYYGFIKE